MDCKHFGSCGSCSIYELDYPSQLVDKTKRVSQLLAPYYDGELGCFDSPQEQYRARAEFRVWHDGDRCNYAMGALDRKGAVTIEECPKVIEAIEKRMWSLLESINSSDILKTKLFAMEFLATTTDEVIITMIYHKKLDQEWEHTASPLQSKFRCSIIGRSRKQKLILSDEFVTERLTIDGKEIIYKQYESGFTQPNPTANIKMIEWAITQAKKSNGRDLLESYCGLGNFTIPLSYHFDKVLATEISKRSIYAAQENCSQNSVENISFIRLSSEEMSQALKKVREFTRLRDVDLDSYDFSTVLVDPPRAGLDKATLGLISDMDAIIYISCNPETLARDLATLTQTHSVEDATIFDQFPHTPHIESGVYLRKT